jgi:WD40 repeat protein
MLGSIGYFNASDIPNINITYLLPSYNDFTFLELSPDQSYFVTSCVTSNLIRFWSTSNWSLIKQAIAHSAGVNGHTWSPDSRYCYSNLFN